MKKHNFYSLLIHLKWVIIFFEVVTTVGFAQSVIHSMAESGRSGNAGCTNSDLSFATEEYAQKYTLTENENHEFYFATDRTEVTPIKSSEIDCSYSLNVYQDFTPIFLDSCSNEIIGMNVVHHIQIFGLPLGQFIINYNNSYETVLSLDMDGIFHWQFQEIWMGADCTFYYEYNIIPLDEDCEEAYLYASDLCVCFMDSKPYYCSSLTAGQLYICPSEPWSVQPDVICVRETAGDFFCENYPFGFGISTELYPYQEDEFLFFATINPCNGDSLAIFPANIIPPDSGPIYLHYGYLDSYLGVPLFISLNNEFYQLSLVCDAEGFPCNDGEIWTNNDVITDQGQCVGTPINDSPPIQLTFLPFDCDFSVGPISIQFTIIGGIPPYELGGSYAGVLNVGEFEYLYSEGEVFALNIADGSGATYHFAPGLLCPACVDASDFLIADISPQIICVGDNIEATIFPDLSQLECYDYTLYYFISDDASPVIYNALALNDTGVFSYTDIDIAQPDHTYYLTSAAVSNMSGLAENFEFEYILYSSPKPFRYTYCPSAPIAQPDDLGIFPAEETVTIYYTDLLSNDEGISLQLTEIGACENDVNTMGNIFITYADSAVFHPFANYEGNDTVCYTIMDENEQLSSSYFVLHFYPEGPCPVQIEIMGLYCDTNTGSLCEFGLYTYEYEWRIHSYAGASCTMTLEGEGDTTFIADAGGYSYFNLITSQPLVGGEVELNTGNCSAHKFQLVSIPCDTIGDLLHISPLSDYDLVVCRGEDYIISPAMYCYNPNNINTMYNNHYLFAISDTILQDAVWKDIWAVDLYNPILGDFSGQFPSSLFQTLQPLYLSFGYYYIEEADTHFVSVIDSSYLINVIDFYPDLVADTVYLTVDATMDIPCTYTQCYWSSGGTGDHTLSEEGWGWVDIISEQGCAYRDSFYVERITGIDKPAEASCAELIYFSQAQLIMAGDNYEEAWQLTLYTTTGQKILYEQGRGVSNVSISSSLSRGIYLVKTEWEDRICVQKIWINPER